MTMISGALRQATTSFLLILGACARGRLKVVALVTEREPCNASWPISACRTDAPPVVRAGPDRRAGRR